MSDPPAAPPEALLPQAPLPETPPAPPLMVRHHWLVRLTHWVNAIVLTGMIASGLRIYQAFPHFGMRGRLAGVPNPLDADRVGDFPHWALLGNGLAPALNWHFALAWLFLWSGAAYLVYLGLSGEWRWIVFRPRDLRPALQMQLYYLHLRREHPPQGKHNALQKGAYTFIVALATLSLLTGFAIYKPVQLHWLTALFGGYELARYWHFVAVWLFVGFVVLHVGAVLLADPASLRAIVTGRYRGRFPSHGA
ncbi:MAG TPA: cytochrome b/b6 domain-containing protein [Gemmatimonadales bacterium]|nr:cytochrome b/b6 domain-containing protein [Gemmatimonadales bacterium]